MTNPPPPAFHLLPASSTRTTLLLVDIQVGLNTTSTAYYGRARSNPSFETNVSALLSAARLYNTHLQPPSHPITIIHVHHLSSHPDSPLYPCKPSAAFQPCAAPDVSEGSKEIVIGKRATSALVGTELEGKLREVGTRQLLVCGIATDHCVSTTVRAAADLEVCKGGREGVWIVDDCTACFDNHGSFDAEIVHKVNIESLQGEFCEVAVVKDLLEKVLR